MLLLWKDSEQVTINSSSEGHIDASIKNDAGMWRFTSFYGNPMVQKRKESWELIKRLSQCSNIPWIIGGDFNEILSSNEKEGGFVRPQSQINAFREAIDSCGLEDLGYEGDKFTWIRSKGSSLEIKERLDRFLANFKFKEMFKDINIKHLCMHNSDHKPIVASLSKDGLRGDRHVKKLIRFEEGWVAFEQCDEIVKGHWKSSAKALIWSIQGKISDCLVKLKNWNHNRLKETIRGAIERQEKEIRLLRNSLDPREGEKIRRAKKELEVLLEEEEKYWKIRSREDWLKWGDRNTKWFHNRANYRMKRNRIDGLMSEDGRWASNNKEIGEVASKYFKVMFSSSNPSNEAIDEVSWVACTTKSQKINLENWLGRFLVTR